MKHHDPTPMAIAPWRNALPPTPRDLTMPTDVEHPFDGAYRLPVEDCGWKQSIEQLSEHQFPTNEWWQKRAEWWRSQAEITQAQLGRETARADANAETAAQLAQDADALRRQTGEGVTIEALREAACELRRHATGGHLFECAALMEHAAYLLALAGAGVIDRSV